MQGVVERVVAARVVVVFSHAVSATWEAFPLVSGLQLGASQVFPHAAVESGASVTAALLASGHSVDEKSLCADVRPSTAGRAVVSVELRDGAKQTIERVLACAATASEGHFAAILVSESPIDQQSVAATRQHVERQAQPPPPADGERPPTYFPTFVWAWLIVVFLIIFFVLAALSSLSGVQVPPKLLSPEQAQHKKMK